VQFFKISILICWILGGRNPDMYDDVPNSATDLQNKDRVSQFQTHMVKHKKYVFFICSSAFTQVKSTGTCSWGGKISVKAVL